MARMVISGPLNVTRTGTLANADLPLLQRAVGVRDEDVDGNELTDEEKLTKTYNAIFRRINRWINKQRKKELIESTVNDDVIEVT